MPRIELIPEVLYGPNDPIYWEIDNLPLKSIITRQNLINLSLDNVLEQMRNAIGTQGSLSNRLNQSIDADGNLKTSAVDSTMHSIEAHEDTDDYVRMTKVQSDKLETIADNAKDFSVSIYTDDVTSVDFEEGVLKIKASSSVTPIFESPDVLKFDLAFPEAAAHQHYYGLTPVHSDSLDPDYINFKVNSIASEFVENTLRVTINGVRIYSDVEIYVPGALVNDPWTLMSFTPDHSNGTFELSSAISEEDIIRIDFDISFI